MAKKVKFAVDLTGFEISPNGVHVTGDFQTIAGFPGGDWAPNTTPLAKEGETDIYAIVVDIPAFQKYEYRFVNGDQFYESEFVPVESRVGYDFNDNRWIFVDSIANDTTFVGAIVFGGNAPANMHLVRFLVNMQNETIVMPEGVHLAGNFQEWNPATIRLYSFVNGIYEIIAYVSPGTYEYRYFNGNTLASGETITGECVVNTNRQIVVTEDMVLEPVCFRYCVDCESIGIRTGITNANVLIHPNPANEFVDITLSLADNFTVAIYNLAGNEVLYENFKMKSHERVDLSTFRNGLYFLVLKRNNTVTTTKLVKN